MNEKAIFEIGDIIHVKIGLFPFRKLSAEEIIKSHEFKIFKESFPELARLAMGDR